MNRSVDDAISTRTTQRPSHCSRWKRFWNSLQVGRQGSYSIERLESLDFYCRNTSRTRVLLVCVLTPIPSLLVIVLLECLPLRPPSEGWAANWVFWIRLGCTIFTMTFAGAAKLVAFAPDFDATFWKRLVVSCGASAAYVATAILGANVVGFPIPMMWILGGSFISIYVPTLALLVFGFSPFAKTSPCRQNLKRFSRYFFAHMTLAGVFPLYKVMYEFIPTRFRGAVMIVLPLWRLLAKNFMVRATRELEDFMPEIIAFTVDFFSALFVSVCMSTSGSIDLAVLFIAADVGQSLLELHDVRAVSKSMQELLQRQQSAHGKSHSETCSSTTDLVSMILSVTRDSSFLSGKSMKNTRLWACLPHAIARQQTQCLNVLDASGVFNNGGSSSIRTAAQSDTTSRHPRPRVLFAQSASIVPAPCLPSEPTPAEITRAMNEIRQDTNPTTYGEISRQIVQEGLQVLFHWEYVALVEYVECIVPLVFVAYKSILEQLPNVVYYPGGAGNFTTTSIVNILVFGALEIGSFLLLNHYLQRKFAFSPLYQLAYVLETQIYSVQPKLFIETALLLQYELAHQGTDFSFRFEWLKNQSH